MIASLSMDSIERQENMLHNVSQLFLKARQGFCVSALQWLRHTYISEIWSLVNSVLYLDLETASLLGSRGR